MVRQRTGLGRVSNILPVQIFAFAYSLTESCKLNNINPYEYWADLIDFIGCEGIDLNSFVHSQWHKHTKVA